MKRDEKKRPKGDIDVIDPQPLFTGRTEKKKPIHHFPSPERAEEWHKESPETRHLRASSSVANLKSQERIKNKRKRKQKEKEDYFEIYIRSAGLPGDEDLPEWETY